MFTYLDPSIRRRLIKEEKLIRIDYEGNRLDSDAPQAPGEIIINLLGPIPMPIDALEGRIVVQWYAAVRSTELQQVEALANKLTSEGGQHLFSSLVSPLAVNSVLVIGEPKDEPLVRVHSNCLTGDVFGSQRCDCGPQLANAIARINDDPAGGYVAVSYTHLTLPTNREV